MSIVLSPWNANIYYTVGTTVEYQNDAFFAASVSVGVPPLPSTPEWTFISPGGGGGGSQTLTQSGDDITLSNGGGTVDVAATTQVAANTVNLTQISYDAGLDVTTVNALSAPNGAVFGADLTADNIIATTIQDVSGSKGAASQVLTAGIGDQLLWSSVAGGYVGYGTFFYDTDVPPYGQGVWNFNGGDLNIQNDATQQTFLNALVQMIDTKGNASLTIWQSPSVYLATIATGYTLTSGVYHFTVPMAVGVFWTNAATTFYLYVTPTAGAEGPQGPTGPEGPTGPAGPFSTPLANKIAVVSASDVPTTDLNWNALPSAGNVYVPLSDALAVAPAAPLTGTSGWRFTKSAPFLAGPGSMVNGTAYTVTVVGNTNWTAIGFTAPVVIGSSGTYNGVAITGTTGYAILSSTYGKYVAWYPLNDLYGLTPPYSLPATAVQKKNMNAVWALVKFNNDLAVQGYISLTLETYNYASPPASGSYTGRWAYSFPMFGLAGGSAQSFGGTGGTALTAVMPRAVAGYTYLLYCEDKYPKFVPNQAGLTFGVSNGMFPSQTSVANTLRDPYDVYPEYPHFPLNAVQYSENGAQPLDRAAAEVATIYFKSTSIPNSPQNLQPGFDFEVLAMGYRGTNGAGTQQQNYTLSYYAT